MAAAYTIGVCRPPCASHNARNCFTELGRRMPRRWTNSCPRTDRHLGHAGGRSSEWETGLWSAVELRGFEPLTSSMPWKRATNCAKAPRCLADSGSLADTRQQRKIGSCPVRQWSSHCPHHRAPNLTRPTNHSPPAPPQHVVTPTHGTTKGGQRTAAAERWLLALGVVAHDRFGEGAGVPFFDAPTVAAAGEQ